MVNGATPVKPDKEVIITIKSDIDVVIARQEGRKMAAEIGLNSGESTLVATAISEVARNIASYAGSGEIVLSIVEKESHKGISVVARDKGPGIPDVSLAMQDGYSTSRGLGLGLPGSKRIMDDFEIESRVGVGTTVRMTKWKR